MSTARALIELKQSPLLPDFIADLQATFAAEQRRREQFIEEMNASVKAEFINGEVIIHSPARLVHLEVVIQTGILLRQYTVRHGLGKVLVEKCLIHCHRNDYEPDICFFALSKTEGWEADKKIFPPPDLIVEVLSPSTEKIDRTVKHQDYARHGVSEYWIIDADGRMVEQYILPPGASEYQLKVRVAGGGRLTSMVVTGLDIPVAAIFDAQENQRMASAILNES